MWLRRARDFVHHRDRQIDHEIPSPNRRIRWGALGAAALVQAVYLAILVAALDRRPEPPAPVQQPEMILTFIGKPSRSSEHPVASALQEPTRAPASLRHVPPPNVALPSDLPAISPTVDGSTVPIAPLIPPIDWMAEAKRAAGDILAREDRQASRRALGVIPKGLDLPRARDQGPHRGETDRFDDGETITWISDRCYYTNRDPAHLPVFITGLQRPLPHPICKPSPTIAPPLTRDALSLDRSDRVGGVP